MKKLLLTFLTLLAVTGVAQASHDNALDDIDIDIVSDHGRHFATFPLRSSNYSVFRAYLEAVPEQNYRIRVRNRGPERIGLVIAVDGRNIISGQRSDLRPDERMYILGPYQSQEYSGWRTSRNRVNRFYFTDAGESYSAAFGDYSAMGVIAVAAFREQPRYHSPQQWDEGRDKSGSRSRKNAPAPGAQKHGQFSDEAGTGYGHDEYSPSRRVSFDPERRAFARYFLKYEWRETLCDKGIADCRRRPANRMWRDAWADPGYAPPPPRHTDNRRRQPWFFNWRW